MKRVVATAVLVALFAVTSAVSAQQFEFKLGFKLLADQIPAIAGQPIENEWHNPENGDGLQRTTTGLMVWRKADNWTAFTNGHTTWINGPYGVQSRLNTERFAWERDISAPVPTDFTSRTSLASCLVRPDGTACVAFSDGYLLAVDDWIVGWADAEPWRGMRVEVAIGRKADYHHVLGTDLVKQVSKASASGQPR
jgi:hypothetical protein